jgi:hypothetical protein
MVRGLLKGSSRRLQEIGIMNSNRPLGLIALGFVASSLLACGAPHSAGAESTAVAESDLSSAARPARGGNGSTETTAFWLHVNPQFAACLAAYPNDASRYPQVYASVQRGEPNDTLTLVGTNVKPGLQFDMFTVERSTFDAQGALDSAFHGFGLAWYQSDLEADSNGNMNATVKTIFLDQIFGFDTDVNLAPRNTFHVGFWFNNPQDAVACHFDASKPTPFNGEHNAGPLAMISIPTSGSNLGPLCTSVDWSVTPPRCNP